MLLKSSSGFHSKLEWDVWWWWWGCRGRLEGDPLQVWNQWQEKSNRAKVNACALLAPPHRTLHSAFSSDKPRSFKIKTNTQSWIPKWLRRLLLHCRLLSCPPGACSSAVRSLDPATKPTPCAPCIRALFIKISDFRTRTTFGQRCVRERN